MSAGRARGRTAPLEIVGRRAGLVVASIPAGMPAEPDRSGADGSASHELARALGVDAREVHALSRLDLGASGLATFAVGAEAKRRGAQLLERGALTREYAALVAPSPSGPAGRWAASVETPRGPRAAATVWRRVGGTAPCRTPAGEVVTPALLALTLETGRFHQIRQHAAGAGAPLLGDRRHGGVTRLTREDGSVVACPRVALHALRVTIRFAAGPWQLTDAPPRDLVAIWAALGGAAEDWSRGSGAEPGG
ncbi:MAG: RNA pseudouridine synthase [Polyangiaceae bacterium]|nr:RNA pseudouridine synthase [Polyangiaceae bacterium]